MNSELIKRWNATVSNDDIVIHCGDVGLGNVNKIASIVQSLNGHKRLILGNHDLKPQKMLEMGFEWVSPFPIIWQEKYIISHEPMQEVPKGYINIYGHIHQNPAFPTFCSDGICVCCERFNYKPVEFSALIREWKQHQNCGVKLKDLCNPF